MLETSNHILGLSMQPLTGNTNQTSLNVSQPNNDDDRTHNHHNHLNTNPVPYEEYLQQWDIMAVGGIRDNEGRMVGDGRERGSGLKKRHKAGFEFRT